ncbi:ABC transporter ATP-binding protein [Deinococcus sp. Marseille-Q6407]|uniref:ABC transporter ATP-binding protein n=1 Tax=Deinococcus sp. Marseille-Q6407 TaxID=2969223 RepID=UPI0021C1EF80|nr:ABC transporter ATP-binding protein [Deinococcus sp. Marseille-Q6407]
MTATPVLSARNLAVRYGSQAVLQGFDLQVAPGEIVAVLGASGVGKSSLLRILAGLQPAGAGEVQLKGQRLNRPHPAMAFAFQTPSLLPWLNVERNVAFGLDFRHQPALDPAERRLRVAQVLAEVGLEGQGRRFPAQLSGGMAQRAALARSFARQPEVLLLDEPFSALDEVRRSEMQTLLLALLQRHQTAVVLITHDIDEALLLADRVVLLGRPAQETSARQLREWTLDLPRPRAAHSEQLSHLRTEVLRCLFEVQQGNWAASPEGAPQALVS